jgi:hypothetical protein
MTQAERRLAAILSADVVGYSRLMAEAGTIRTLTAYRESIGSLVRWGPSGAASWGGPL